MKRILTISTLLLFLAISFFSCEKYAENIPYKINKMISDRSPFKVTEYQYENALYYLFQDDADNKGCTSFYVFNKRGKSLCSSRGYNEEIYNDFCANAKKIRIIWTKATEDENNIAKKGGK